MKRVVITGIGIISSIGNDKLSVLNSLQALKSGITFSKSMQDFGMRSNVCGNILLPEKKMHRSNIKFMSDASLYAYLSMKQAIKDSRLKKTMYQKNYRVGLIVGIGCNFFQNAIYKFKKKKILNTYSLIKNMVSNVSACLSVSYHIHGISYSLSSACATSANCIGNAMQLIQSGLQDIVFSGGAEEVSCELAYGFDCMHVLSAKYNNIPQQASRAYDINRDGFIISGGAGIVVLEELTHALSRNAPIYAEIIGYGTASDGNSMILPSGLGVIESMKQSMKHINILHIDYINTHGTSTKLGDIIELRSIQSVFKNHKPYISSTKSLTGHSLGASGVHEIIYIILMMLNNFIVPSINIESLDLEAESMNILLYKIEKKIFFALSNSVGFGGVNVSIVIKRYY
ncbi:3-oxoacyl-[acyl-carrier-protein] synthase 1 [Buchnera aphidicola (Pterocallis alni)]|uniref:beta-ketoacyl synthase N-terminal-like domain-containing protein n=1 Tax=Buchnera aphidicola TaxID=9 RepID=UPI003463C7CB